MFRTTTIIRWTIPAVAAIALSGCSAIRAQQGQQIVANAKACLSTIAASPDGAVLARRTPLLPGQEPTLDQLSDPSLITPAEAAALATYHPRLQYCRRQIIEGAQAVSPAEAPLFEATFAAADDDLVALKSGRMTWGEVNRRARDRGVIAKAKDQEIAQQQQALAAQQAQAAWIAASARLLQPRQPPTVTVNQAPPITSINCTSNRSVNSVYTHCQ